VCWCCGVLVFRVCLFGVVVGGLSSSCLGSCGLPFWVETTVELIKGRQPGGGVEEWSGRRGFSGSGLGFFAFWLSGFSDWLLLVSLVGWFACWSFGNWDRGFGIDVLAFLSFFLFDYSCS